MTNAIASESEEVEEVFQTVDNRPPVRHELPTDENARSRMVP